MRYGRVRLPNPCAGRAPADMASVRLDRTWNGAGGEARAPPPQPTPWVGRKGNPGSCGSYPSSFAREIIACLPRRVDGSRSSPRLRVAVGLSGLAAQNADRKIRQQLGYANAVLTLQSTARENVSPSSERWRRNLRAAPMGGRTALV